ncbi:MAG: hypothetical protein JWM72_3928 [Actinomycetia bacterium]|nr:hypothetical protein [Actinomycetes bacterium]
MFAATLSIVSWSWAATPAGAAPVALGGVAIAPASQGVVDVYVDGNLILLTGPSEPSTPIVHVSAGIHRVDVRRAAQPATSAPLLSGDIAVSVGHDTSAAVNLTTNGKPEISVYPGQGGAVPSVPAPVIEPPTTAPPPSAVHGHDSPTPAAPANPVPPPAVVAAGTPGVSTTQAGTQHAPSQRMARPTAVITSVRWIRFSTKVAPSSAPITTPDALAWSPSVSASDPGGTTGISALAEGGLAAVAAFINDHLIVLDILGVVTLLSLSVSRGRRRAHRTS